MHGFPQDMEDKLTELGLFPLSLDYETELKAVGVYFLSEQHKEQGVVDLLHSISTSAKQYIGERRHRFASNPEMIKN
jgi:hypothetical protein